MLGSDSARSERLSSPCGPPCPSPSGECPSGGRSGPVLFLCAASCHKGVRAVFTAATASASHSAGSAGQLMDRSRRSISCTTPPPPTSGVTLPGLADRYCTATATRPAGVSTSPNAYSCICAPRA
jgi:hypothetical protein